MFNSAKSDLDTMMCSSPRYPDNNTYYPNNWGSNSTYPSNYNYYGAPNNNQQYTGTPTMVLYPHLYSTVNQNQIHLHLHGSTEKIDQYLTPDALTVASSRNALEAGTTHPSGGETQQGAAAQIEDTDRVQTQSVTDPASVWRPY